MNSTRTSLAPAAGPRTRRSVGVRPVAAPGIDRQGKLNLFQRTMLRWRELRPYSAAHVVRVAKPLDEARLHDLINRRFEALGLTGFVLDPDAGSFRREGGTADLALRVLAESADPFAALWTETEAQLNTPFPRAGRMSAFRFFAIAGGDGFYLGLVYDHFIAGGDAIVLLLKGIVDDYSDGGARAHPAPYPRLAPPAYRRLLLRHPLSALRAMLRLPSLIAGARRVVRPPASRSQDPYTALAYLRLDPDDVEGLRRAAAAWDVTLNDLLLASLLLALAPLAPERDRAPRRRELAVASIVNIRDDLPEATDAFGPFLASFQISHAVPPGITLRELARDVHAGSARVKSHRLYLPALAALGVGGLMWRFLSPAQRLRFFSKYHPAWGGLSLLNVNALWERAGSGAAPAEYLRLVCTGPACPLVFTVTAVRDVLHVGISFCISVFSRATVEGVKASFVRAVAALREGTHG